MENTDSLQHLTPIAKLLIPYYKRKHNISLTSNLIIHREEIQELKEKFTVKGVQKESLYLYTLDGPTIRRTLGERYKDGPAIEKILAKDLPPLGIKGTRAGYLFYNSVSIAKSRYDDESHCELLLVDGDKIIIPISFFGTPYITILPKSYYRLPVTTDMNIAPSSSEETECNLLSILYAKALLKNDGQYLKESIFFEKYNSNGEIERIFVPHPEVLKYSHSNQYNKYILSLISDGKYSHKGKDFGYPSIREMLSESIENIEKLRTNNPETFTKKMEQILADNKALLAELPSIDEKFKTHYESKVLPCRENIQEDGKTPWNRVKREKFKKKLPAYSTAYLKEPSTEETTTSSPRLEEGGANVGLTLDENAISEASQSNFKKSNEDKNIHVTREIMSDIEEAIREPLKINTAKEDKDETSEPLYSPQIQAQDIKTNQELLVEKGPTSILDDPQLINPLERDFSGKFLK